MGQSEIKKKEIPQKEIELAKPPDVTRVRTLIMVIQGKITLNIQGQIIQGMIILKQGRC